MAHEGILATKGEINVKVGERVDTTGYTEANINARCKHAEAFISNYCKFDFVTNWDNLDAVMKPILSDFVSSWVANSFIAYNMEAYGSRIQAENLMLNNEMIIKFILKMLESRGGADFLAKT